MPEMERDDSILVEFILLKFDQLATLLEELEDGAANTQLDIPGSNSVVQLMVHCCGALRRWSSTVNLGIEVPRDRDAEFLARMSVMEALALATRTRSEFLKDIALTEFSASPINLPEGRSSFWTASCRGVLLHLLEEISQHLGHAQITRDALLAGLGTPPASQSTAGG